MSNNDYCPHCHSEDRHCLIRRRMTVCGACGYSEPSVNPVTCREPIINRNTLRNSIQFAFEDGPCGSGKVVQA